jgi:hypothetical protein
VRKLVHQTGEVGPKRRGEMGRKRGKEGKARWETAAGRATASGRQRGRRQEDERESKIL